MAKKWTKGIVGLAAIGAAAAGILYMKNKKDNEDLDDDLSDTSGREYVPLNNAVSSEETDADSSSEENSSEETEAVSENPEDDKNDKEA